jgi:rod shape-determining protein MreD
MNPSAVAEGILGCAAAALIQLRLAPFLWDLGIPLDFVWLWALFVAMYAPREAGVPTGFAAGLWIDLMGASRLGPFALGGVCACALAQQLRKGARCDRTVASSVVVLALSLLGLGIGATMTSLFSGAFDIVEGLRRAAIQAAVAAPASALLFYALRLCLGPTGWVPLPGKSRRGVAEDAVGPSGYPVARR